MEVIDVVNSLQGYIVQELGWQQSGLQPKYSTVSSFLEHKYSTQLARDEFAEDLQKLHSTLSTCCPAQSDRLYMTPASPRDCVLEVPNPTEVPGVPDGLMVAGRRMHVYRLHLWHLAFNSEMFLSGVEPTVHILGGLKQQLMGNFIDPAVPAPIVSFNLAGLESSDPLPHFSVYTCAGAEDVILAVLAGHCLLHVHDWPEQEGMPRRATLEDVVQALSPQRLLFSIFRVRVLVPDQEAGMSYVEWIRMYLDYAHRHQPNPLQIYKVLRRRANQHLQCGERNPWHVTIHEVNDSWWKRPGGDTSVRGVPGVPDEWIDAGLWHADVAQRRICEKLEACILMLASAGPVFRGLIEAG